MNWLRRLLARNRLERELDAELRYHFDRQVESHVAAGMSEQEARRAARLEFGGIDQVKELCRDARGTRWVDDFLQDLRFAWRLLRKERGFTAVAVLALGLGIGVNNTFFTVVNAVCLRGLPIVGVDRVMYLFTRDARDHDQGLSSRDFEDTQAATSSAFEGLAAFTAAAMVVGDEDRAADRVPGAYTSANGFPMLREPARLGRHFRSEDDRPGANPVVILLCTVVWQRLLGDPTQAYQMTDPVVLLAVCLSIVIVGFLASYWPARRAAALDPVAALRSE